MIFAGLDLSRRLESAEAFACAQFAAARQRLFPESEASWTVCDGTTAIFDGVDSPCTQTFGLGLFQEISPVSLQIIEGFFLARKAPVFHEVSPFAGVPTLDLLCQRGYRPEELSTVLCRPVDPHSGTLATGIRVREVGPEEATLWSDISARAWGHNHPELFQFLREVGALSFARKESRCFIAEIDGVPGAAGALAIHEGVALFAGAATVPEFRHHGLQSALLAARMESAHRQGCDLAMIVSALGTDSQRNAERKGFRVAYTRTKWRLRA